jgi:hypothetical protein
MRIGEIPLIVHLIICVDIFYSFLSPNPVSGVEPELVIITYDAIEPVTGSHIHDFTKSPCSRTLGISSSRFGWHGNLAPVHTAVLQ